MLPDYDDKGDLPAGIHPATLADVEQRFGRFTVSDRRVSLFAKLNQVVELAKASGIAERIIIAGSFVTAKLEPNDVDLVIVLAPEVEFGALTPSQYAVADRDALRRVLRGGGCDVIVARAGTKPLQAAIEFFQTNRNNKAVGVVELRL
jgi:hypothetical protein